MFGRLGKLSSRAAKWVGGDLVCFAAWGEVGRRECAWRWGFVGATGITWQRKRWERRWECVRHVRQISWRRWGWWDDVHGIGRGFSVANLLLDFWLCQCDVQSSEILWWMERVRSVFVGRMWGWMRERCAANFAAASMFSLPRMPRWLGAHMEVS